MAEVKRRLVFFGNERLATGVTTDTPVLRSLVAAGYEIAAIVVAQGEAQPSRSGRQLEVLAFAEEHKIAVLAPSQPAAILQQLTSLNAEAGVLVAYGKLPPRTILDSFPHGIINLHPSLLPKHRGPTPIEHVILSGEAETGVSLMQLSEKMDAVTIFAQETVALEGNETKQGL